MAIPYGRIPTRGSQSTPEIVRINNTLIQEPFDYIGVTFPAIDTEVYVYKKGGATGTTIATLTIVYVDSTKASLLSLTRT